MHVLTLKEGFYLAASHRQIKKSILCDLGVSALKILFWTRVIHHGKIDYDVTLEEEFKFLDEPIPL